MLKYLLTALLGLAWLLELRAQDKATNVGQDPRVGAAESSYFNTAKLLSKGQVSKSFPLFSKNMNSFNYRLSLDYDGGNGLKIYNPGSVVGKGWKLDFGGMIVREKRGRNDEDHYGEPYGPVTREVAGFLHVKDWHFIQLPNDAPSVFVLDRDINSLNSDAYEGYKDQAQDVFSFSFMGKSGQFKLTKTNGEIKAEIFPRMNLDIKVYYDYGYNTYAVPYDNNPIPTISAFSITDEYANTYFFEEADTYVHYDYPEVNSWQLKMIIPSSSVLYEEDKLKNAIVFDYYKINSSNPSDEGFSYVILDKIPRWDSESENRVPHKFTPNRLMFTPKTIRFPDNTLIKFNYQRELKTNENVFVQVGLLKSIEIFEEQNVLTSKYDFKYQTPKLNNGILEYQEHLDNVYSTYVKPNEFYKWYLKSFDFNGKEVNNFEYYHNELANEENLITDRRDVTRAADYYGYPNGDTYRSPITFSDLALDNSLPNSNYTNMGMLKKINYRTGGYEHFLYEPNLRDSLGTTMTVGGVRLRRHSLIDPTNSMNNRVTEYSYKNAIDTNRSSGFFGNKPILLKYFHYTNLSYPAPVNRAYYMINPLGHNSRIANLVGYSSVRETQFQFNGTSYELYKSAQYEYTDVNDINSEFKPSSYYYPVDIYFDMPLWVVGHLKKKTELDKNNRMIREELNEYDISQYPSLRSLKMDLYGLAHGWREIDGTFEVTSTCIAQNYYSAMGHVNLTKKIVREYDLSNSLNRYVSNVELYTYNANNQLASKTVGNNELTPNESYNYVYHYYYKGRFNLPTLVEKYDRIRDPISNNNIKRLIEAKNYEYIANEFELNKDDYRYIYNFDTIPLLGYSLSKSYESRNVNPLITNIAPYNASLQVQPGRGLELTSQQNLDIYGKVLNQTDEFGVKTNYLYDRYHKLIATFHNGDDAQFKYFSFEDSERKVYDPIKDNINDVIFNNTKIQLDGTIGSVSDENAISGNKVLRGLFSVHMPIGRYVIKLWGKGQGTLTVGGSTVQLGNEWKLYDFKIELISASNITFNSGSGGYLDNVMVYPENGSITATSYTYNDAALSEYFLRTYSTAPNGMVSVSDFDREGRQLALRDHKGNIRESKVYVEP